MVKADFGGDYLNVDSCNDGDIWEILEKPTHGTIQDKFNNGKEKKVTNILVQCNEKKLIYTPTNKIGKSMVKAWGDEMDNWVGKKFQTLHIEDKLVVRPIAETPK